MIAGARNRPGVVVEHFPPPAALEFRTGVTGFVASATWAGAIGALAAAAPPAPRLYTSWHDYRLATTAGDPWRADELLWDGVQGLFGNGGTRCWVALYDARSADPRAALDQAVGALAAIDDVDLVCAPSLMIAADPLAMQQQLIRSFEQRDDWFLILDPPDPASRRDLAPWIADLRAAPCSRPHNVALYHPWISVGGDYTPPPDVAHPRTTVPPSGHVAGVFARTDQRVGAHKAPSNEPVEGAVDVVDVPDVAAANPLRALPGRGIRVWGARTLVEPRAEQPAPDELINLRRMILTLERWLVRAFDWAAFEANDFHLWVRIHRELDARLTQLFLQGAFAGATPSEAFSIKCDADNNPADVRARGELRIDLEVAPIAAKESIQIRVVRNAEGTVVA